MVNRQNKETYTVRDGENHRSMFESESEDKLICFSRFAIQCKASSFAYDEELRFLLGVGLPTSPIDIRNQGPDHIRKRRITMPVDINA